MKTGLHSRTNVLHGVGALAGIVFAIAAAVAPGKVSAELAEAVAALLLLAFAGAGGYLKADDRKKLRTAADMLIEQNAKNAKSAAKAAAKVGAGLALALLCGCGPTWQLCEVDLSNHPQKPRPAASARVRCSRTVLCDVAEGARCDGEVLAKGAK